MAERSGREVAAALREERAFVAAFGGYSIEVAGGVLVTNERVPVPRFNFVQEVRVAPERQTAFFERALDHYFQRALRPTFRVEPPAPAHVDRALRRFGFLPRPEPRTLLVAGKERPAAPAPAPTGAFSVREAGSDELDSACRFWVGVREQEEFRRALEVAWTHPNPGEQLAPWLAIEDGSPVAAALLYRWQGHPGIHSVATHSAARGRGAASALVTGMLDSLATPERFRTGIESDTDRLLRRLRRLGFSPVRAWTVYELPPNATLTMPDPGPPQPPRWRPPRTARPAAP
jgi:hypothetical protein